MLQVSIPFFIEISIRAQDEDSSIPNLYFFADVRFQTSQDGTQSCGTVKESV